MTSKYKHIVSKKTVNSQIFISERIQKLHNEMLGLNVPENYFSNTKQEVLALVTGKKEHAIHAFFLKPATLFYATASITLLIAFTLIKPETTAIQMNDNKTIASDTIKTLNEGEIKDETLENDILISSLFLEDSDVDAFIDDYVLDETITETDETF